MTISTSASTITYQGNGTTTVFPFAFPVSDATTLVVTITDNTQSPAVITTLTASQYTVTGIGSEAGGSVTYPLAGSPLAAGVALTLRRVVAYVQGTSLVNQGGFYPDVLEGALDALTEQTQQLAEGLSRAMQVPVGSGLDPNAYLPTIQAAQTDAANSAAGASTSAANAAASASAAATSATSLPNAASIGAGKIPVSTGTAWTGATPGAGTVTSVATAGLATGGPITAGGTVTVTASSNADAIAGTRTDVAVVPANLPRVITALAPKAAPFRNLLIGGDFTTNPWQRGTAFTGVSSATINWSADRWKTLVSGSSQWTIGQQADGPTMAQAGVYSPNCLEIKCTSAVTSPTASDYVLFHQVIEGFNSAVLGFGQTGAMSVTLSFWYKTGVSGSYSIFLQNSAGNRSYIGVAALTGDGVWHQATLTAPGDTAGTWLQGNNAGLYIGLALVCGTTAQGAAGTWQGSVLYATNSSPANLGSAVNNYLRLSLIQLEAGPTATPFETLPGDVVLARCQRYFEMSFSSGALIGTSTNDCCVQAVASSGNVLAGCRFKVKKRAGPTVVVYAANGTSGSVSLWNNGSVTYSGASAAGYVDGISYLSGFGSGLTTGQQYIFNFTANSEL